MSPYQHGEVYVTDDGGETDLDLGHYERFTSARMSRGQQHHHGQGVRDRDREGAPRRLPRAHRAGDPPHHGPDQGLDPPRRRDVDVVIVEIGGTVGDIEGLPFLEAVRQLKKDVGKDNVIYVHLTLVPFIQAAAELKTKATQHSVKELRAIGIQPDVLLCRTAKDHPLTPSIKSKIALFCDVEEEAVIAARDVDTIYEVPLAFHDQGLDESIVKMLGLPSAPADLGALGGDRPPDQGAPPPLPRRGGRQVHRGEGRVQEPLRGPRPRRASPTRRRWRWCGWTPSASSARALAGHVVGLDGILVPGGFGDRGIEGKIQAIRYAREEQVPVLRHLPRDAVRGDRVRAPRLRARGRQLHGVRPHARAQRHRPPARAAQSSGTRAARCASASTRSCVHEGSAASRALRPGHHPERHRHRYEVNNDYLADLEKSGLRISGIWAEKQLVEIIELPDHPWFVAGPVPSGVPLAAVGAAPALRRVREGGARPAGSTRSPRHGDPRRPDRRRHHRRRRRRSRSSGDRAPSRTRSTP